MPGVVVRVPPGVSVLVVTDPTVSDVRLELTSQPTWTSTPSWRTPDVDALLARFATHAATRSWDHERVAETLAELGYKPSAPASRDGGRPSRAYIRWTVRGDNAAVTMYQEGSGLVIDSNALLSFADWLPGAHVAGGQRPRAKWHYENSLDGALDAARAVRDFANGKFDRSAHTADQGPEAE